MAEAVAAAGKKRKLGADYWRLWSATAITNLGDGVAVVAYPWLASAVTRSPILIAVAAMIGRLPWLLFTLPAGVITDRLNRKKIIVSMDLFRGLLTFVITSILILGQWDFPDLDSLRTGVTFETQWALYWVILISALLFGSAEVLRDNAAQTLMPSIVGKENLERANGRMWSAEFLTNSMIGPALGSFLIGVAIYLPFLADGMTFIFAAILIASIKTTLPVAIKKESKSSDVGAFAQFRSEIAEGVKWLWSHHLLRSMAIILGLLNLLGSISGALFILFAQEVLQTTVFLFALLGTAGAIGGILGGLLGPKVSSRFGSGATLAAVLLLLPILEIGIGLSFHWLQVWFLICVSSFMSVIWNVITVSLRQSIIPSELLGRVNSVYRLFAWGSIPIGLALAGGLVQLSSLFLEREWALRAPYLVAGVAGLILFLGAKARLTEERISRAKEEAQAQTPERAVKDNEEVI